MAHFPDFTGNDPELIVGWRAKTEETSHDLAVLLDQLVQAHLDNTATSVNSLTDVNDAIRAKYQSSHEPVKHIMSFICGSRDASNPTLDQTLRDVDSIHASVEHLERVVATLTARVEQIERRYQRHMKVEPTLT